MKPHEGLNLNLYPAYLPEILIAGEAIPGVPDYRRLLAPGYEPHAHRIPDADNTAVVAKGKFESRVSVPVGSYVWAFSGYSSHADGFRVRVIDTGTGAGFWSAMVKDTLLSGQGQTVAGAAYPLVPIERPRLVIEPGLLTVQVENLADAVNQIYFVIWTAEPQRTRT